MENHTSNMVICKAGISLKNKETQRTIRISMTQGRAVFLDFETEKKPIFRPDEVF